jgi:putative transposase
VIRPIFKSWINPKTAGIIWDALYDAAERHGMAIKEMSFGEDFAHVHMEVSIPNTMSISYAVQLLKGYSSYKVFKEMPRHRLRYFKGHFWTAGYSNGSVGPRDENTLQNYIRKQDISGQLHLAV